MGDYSLSRFDTREFEHLVQSLAKRVIAAGVMPFGDGPDGGREATFNGKMEYPSLADPWNGYLVIQCKYLSRSANGSKKDGDWVINELKKELKKYLSKERKIKNPEYFLFVTNVVLTPSLKNGSKDRVIDVLEEYAPKIGIKRFDIWCYDNICRFLDDNDAIRRSYTHLLTPGDVLDKMMDLTTQLRYAIPELGMNKNLSSSALIDDFNKIEFANNSQLIDKQLSFLRKRLMTSASHEIAQHVLLALSVPDKSAMGLLCAATVLRHTDYLDSLYPEYKWASLLQKFSEQGLIIKLESGWIEISEDVQQIFEEDEDLVVSHLSWIERLVDKLHHCDLAFEYCLHLCSVERWEDSIEISHNWIVSVDTLSIADQFVLIASALAAPEASRLYHKLNVKHRILLHDALGVNLIRHRQWDQAITHLNKVLKLAKQDNDQWATTQALLHLGIAFNEAGDRIKAEKFYLRAKENASDYNQPWLLGRILNNLFYCQLSYDFEKSKITLNESIILKRKTRDVEGLIAAYNGQGLVEVEADQHEKAIAFFRKAKNLALKLDDKLGLMFSLHNESISLSAQGKRGLALVQSLKALEAARIVGQERHLELVIQGAAVLSFEYKKYESALQLFDELANIRLRRGDFSGAVIALSDVGASELRLGRIQESRLHFKKSLELALESNSWGSAKLPIENFIASCHQSGNSSQAVSFLETVLADPRASASPEFFVQAARILVDILLGQGASAKRINMVWDSTLRAANRLRERSLRIEILNARYVWIRDTQTVAAAIESIQFIIKLTKRYPELRNYYISALCELGNHQQSLNDFKSALKTYKRALRLSKGYELTDQISIICNNLAEIYRKTGNITEAILLYTESLNIDRDQIELSEQLLVEHNLALALLDTNKKDEAEEMFQSICQRAKKNALWEEYSKALLGLGDIAWKSRDRTRAHSYYSKARGTATKHGIQQIIQWSVINEIRLFCEQLHAERAHDFLIAHENNIDNDELIDLWRKIGETYWEKSLFDQAATSFEQSIRLVDKKSKVEIYESLKLCLKEARERIPSEAKEADLLAEILSSRSDMKRRSALLKLLSKSVEQDLSAPDECHFTSQILDKIKERSSVDPTYFRLLLAGHSFAGEIAWGRDPEFGIQIYIAGMVVAFSTPDSVSVAFEIGNELQGKLHRLGAGHGLDFMRKMHKRIFDWLQLQSTNIENKTIKFSLCIDWLLWPLNIVISTLEARSNGVILSSKEINKIVKKAMDIKW